MLLLKREGLALRDVMVSCVREGSPDADIDEASIVPNDFPAFFDAHPPFPQKLKAWSAVAKELAKK